MCQPVSREANPDRGICCCCSLRTGSFLIGCLDIVYGLYLLLNLVFQPLNNEDFTSRAHDIERFLQWGNTGTLFLAALLILIGTCMQNSIVIGIAAILESFSAVWGLALTFNDFEEDFWLEGSIWLFICSITAYFVIVLLCYAHEISPRNDAPLNQA